MLNLEHRMKRIHIPALVAFILAAPSAMAQAAAESPAAGGVGGMLLSLAVYTLPVVGIGLLGLVAWGMVSWRGSLLERASQSKVFAVIARALEVAEAVVRDLEVTMKPELEAASADGVLTKEEMQRIKSRALEQLKTSLGEHGLKEIQETLKLTAGGLGVFLSGLIEKALDLMKVTKAAAKKPAAAATVLNIGPGAEVEQVGNMLHAKVPQTPRG